MATTLTAQPLLVTINTQITLNGNTINSENALTITDINEYDKRIMPVSVYGTVLVGFGGTVGAGTFIKGDMKYFQVTNLDSLNYANIIVARAGVNAFGIRLDAGKTFMMGNVKEGVAYSPSPTDTVTLVDAYSISAIANNANVDVEYIVAST